MTTEVEKLQNRLKAKRDLLSVSFSFMNLHKNATIDMLCFEVNNLLDAVDNGKVRTLSFNDSKGVICQ